ncbi:MAG: hypothetical protein GYA52_01390 [Chloroflexi bacterium]|nr:hypothetical protein [Chloroflexota bacterium]
MQAGSKRLVRIILKTLLVLLVFNFAFPLLEAVPLQRLSVYNVIFPGRLRLPFGETPELAYNLTLNDVDAMLASHVVSGGKSDQDVSVFLLGDSSIWGTLLTNEETLASQLQQMIHEDGSTSSDSIHVYNLGYPTTSALKDLVILDQAMQYQPDTVIWFVTLNSLIKNAHLDAPVLTNNPEKTNAVIAKYQLGIKPLDTTTYWEKTFINERRNIYDRIHLQLLAPMWASTGIDQYIPAEYTPAARDLEVDMSYADIADQQLRATDLELDILTNFQHRYPDVNVIIVNEPILISAGSNSDIRYNYYYPRWAYDQYRQILSTKMRQMGIKYIDFWDAVPESLFTNSAIHYNVQGVNILVEKLYLQIQKDISN